MSTNMKMTVTEPQQTKRLGEKLASKLQAGDVILLDGDLGAGKTTFTKGVAKGLGVQKNVKSPTFTIVREYQDGRLPLYHMDAYRLEGGGSDELGLDEYFGGNGVSVLEWSKFVAAELPTNYLRIKFKRDDQTGANYREIEFIAKGTHFNDILMSGVLNLDE